MYLDGKAFEYLPFVISIYDTNGISSDEIACCKERLDIFDELPIKDENAIQMVKEKLKKNTRKAFIRKYFWRFVPSKFRQIRCDYLRKKGGWKTEKEFFLQGNNNIQT